MQYSATLLDETRAPLAGRTVKVWTCTGAWDEALLATYRCDDAGQLRDTAASGVPIFKRAVAHNTAPTNQNEYSGPVSFVQLKLVSGGRELLLSLGPAKVVRSETMVFGALIVREWAPLVTVEGVELFALPEAMYNILYKADNPRLVGLTATAARRSLAERGLTAQLGTVSVASAELDGRVVEQRPDPATSPNLAPGSAVQLWLGRAEVR